MAASVRMSVYLSVCLSVGLQPKKLKKTTIGVARISSGVHFFRQKVDDLFLSSSSIHRLTLLN